MVRLNPFMVRLALVFGLVVVPALVAQGSAYAQTPEGYVEVLRSYPAADFGVAEVAGLAYSPPADNFLILEAQDPAQAADTTRAVLVTPYQDPAGEVEIPAAAMEVQNTAFDESNNRLVMFDQASSELIAVPVDAAGKPDPSGTRVTRFNGRGLGIRRAQGVTFNPANGRVYILDAPGRRVVHVTPDGQRRFDGPGARVGQFNLNRVGGQLRGIAFHPVNGHIFVLSPSGRRLNELTETGELISTRNLTRAGLRDPQSILIAPSADATDDPQTMNLFVADGSGVTESSQIVELTLQAPDFSALAAFTPTGPTLVRTIDTSKAAWNPSSPDPSGIAFQPSTGQLLISDGEVEENHPDFQGFNVFRSTLGGSLTGTCTTVGFSNEPTGMGVNPANGRVYISDDNQDRIYEINLGPDGQYCTSDDTRTFVSVTTYGTIDAESVAIGGGTMYIADGVGAEIWVVPLGPNGVLGGGDDGPVTHWDTTPMVLRDPEGVEYNPETGTLYIVSTNTSDRRIVEATTTGAIVRVLDITFLGNVPRSGLAFGPGSQGGNARSLYMANRGVDNGADPNENDGKIYEIAVGTSDTGPTNTPAPPTNTPTNTPVPPTNTPTNTATNTPVPPTATNTNTPTNTPVGPTNTPTDTSTPTNTPVPPTPTDTSTPTNTPTTPPVGGTTLTFGPVADTHVEQGAPASNFGTLTSLNVDGSGRSDILIRFTVSGVNGQPVTGARLRLYCVGASVQGGSFYRVADSSWGETAVTWNTVPAADATALASLGAVAASTFYEVDLSSLITGDGTYSLRVISTNSDGADYASKERSNATQRPQLIVTVGGATGPTNTPTNTPVPPTSTNTPTPSDTPTNTPVGPTSTPTNTPTPSNTPTNTPAGGATLTFGSAADTYVQASTPASNFGAGTSVNVDTSPEANALFKFVVSGVGGRQVTSVKLRLYTVGGSDMGGQFRRVADNSWTETGVNWSNAPAADTAVLATLGAVTQGSSYEVDLTALVTGDGTYSLRVTSASPTSNGADYGTKERSNAAQRPQLIVTVAP